MPEYLKFLDAERTGRLKRSKIKDALIRLSRTPPLNVVAQKLIAEKRVRPPPNQHLLLTKACLRGVLTGWCALLCCV